MTQVTRYGEITQTAMSSFAEDGVKPWKLVSTDADGKVGNE